MQAKHHKRTGGPWEGGSVKQRRVENPQEKGTCDWAFGGACLSRSAGESGYLYDDAKQAFHGLAPNLPKSMKGYVC